ncbi:substrate-binding periplasmic protein [Bermanella sp. WJH001]|uniref:substrate-binding periplasmic protein n=1 Tax=Bermanella sp. WJH001 TaxID=3048005 RepID=UPI0024BE79AD|nr:transporter substrate-binding domain-containing protein [Bermanella sp. WJH001]MDJ1539203.1 transporter substrate-binding domain-containing protein [Bermanella sp. WJH001]
MSVLRCLSVIMLAVFAINLHAQTISIRADYWYPMNGDPTSKKPGYMIELAKAIFEPQGITVDYQLKPWSRSIQETRIGKSDCVVGAYKVSVPDFIFPKQHWGLDQTLFYTLANDDWRYLGDVRALDKRKMGVISDYSYGKKLDEIFIKINAQSAKGDNALETNIKKILTGRIDTMIESHYVMANKLMEMQLSDKIISAGDTQQGAPMYLACTPNTTRTQKFITLVNQAMPKLKASGQLQKILSTYNIESW